MITTLLLPLSLAFIMFSMVLGLTVEDFRRLLSHPLAMGFGLFSQIVMLPAIAFGLASLFALQPELAVGLIILAASPGGITSNLLTHIAGGDGALSVSLTAVTSLAGVITIPIMVNLGLSHYAGATEAVQLPLATMITGIFFIATLPLLLGMALRRFRHGWAPWLEPRSRKLAFQDHLLLELSDEVARQQSEIEGMRTDIRELQRQVRSLSRTPLEGAVAQQEPPPPHY